MPKYYKEKRRRYGENRKRNSKEEIKNTLRKTLNVLDGFIEARRRGSNKCENDSSCSTNNERQGNCDKCIVAARRSCNAPVMRNLLNTVFTPLPKFRSTINVYTTTTTILPNINYYVMLPNKACSEVRLLWPLVWMIPQLISRLTVMGSGMVQIPFILNVLSNKLIKDPVQLQSTLNTGNANGPCMCNTINTTQYNYVFNLEYAAIPPSLGASGNAEFIRGSVTFSIPNNPNFLTLQITVPNGALLSPAPASQTDTFNLFYNDVQVFSPAQYISFIPSCKNDGFWFSTMLNTVNGNI